MSVYCKSSVLALIALTLLSVASGCGGSGRPRLSKVTGKVTLDDQPLAGAQVALLKVTDKQGQYQRPSHAMTDANGEFSPATYGENDGLPTGKYKVAVIKREMVGEPPAGFDEETAQNFNVRYKWVTPRKYSDPATSGLEIEVTSAGIQPESIALSTEGKTPEIEVTGPQSRANEP